MCGMCVACFMRGHYVLVQFLVGLTCCKTAFCHHNKYDSPLCIQRPKFHVMLVGNATLEALPLNMLPSNASLRNSGLCMQNMLHISCTFLFAILIHMYIRCTDTAHANETAHSFSLAGSMKVLCLCSHSIKFNSWKKYWKRLSHACLQVVCI